jgi:hypothetical protein
MMLSYASNFRPNQRGSTNRDGLSSENRPRTTTNQEEIQSQLNKFEEAAASEVNYKYDPNYNYFPELQNQDENSTFYMMKNNEKSEKAPSRGNLKSPMSKTGSSFNKVKFRDHEDFNTGREDL